MYRPMQPFWEVWLGLRKWDLSVLFSEEHLQATFRTRCVLCADDHCARACRGLSDTLNPQELNMLLDALHDHHHHFLPPSTEEMAHICKFRSQHRERTEALTLCLTGSLWNC